MPIIIILISTIVATITPFTYSAVTISSGLAAVFAIMNSTTDKNTPLSAAVLTLITNPFLYLFGATRKYKVATSIFAFAMFAFIVPGLLLSGMRVVMLTDQAVVDDQKYMFENVYEIASAAQMMAKNVEDAKTKVEIIEHEEYYLSAKDKLGQKMLKSTSRLLDFLAPEGLDMDYVISMDEVLFQSHIVYLLDKSFVGDGSITNTDDPSKDSPPVFGFMCGMDADGNVLTLSTLPKGIFGNYVRADWAAPLVHICKDSSKAYLAK